MARETRERKARLRSALTDLAEARIEAAGLKALRARDLAKQAGCSVGAIYNVFDDLDALVLEVNGRTFARLGETVSRSVAAAQGAGPLERLIVMSHAYLHFADQNSNLWRALFDVEMTVESAVPAWYMDAMGRLFSLIMDPLSDLFPNKTEQELDLLTRALFSAVHGIVLLGLQRRISGVPVPLIEKMISEVLSQFGLSISANTGAPRTSGCPGRSYDPADERR